MATTDNLWELTNSLSDGTTVNPYNMDTPFFQNRGTDPPKFSWRITANLYQCNVFTSEQGYWADSSVAVRAPNTWGYGPLASAIARAYNGGLRAEHPTGSSSRAPGQGAEAPWRWSTFSFRTFNRSRKFAHFSKIWKCKNQIFVLSLQKIMGGHMGGWSKTNWGPVPPPPSTGLKPPLPLGFTLAGLCTLCVRWAFPIDSEASC